MSDSRKLPLRPLICYSIGNVTLTAIYGFLGSFLLKYYTDFVHLDPAWIGWALFIRALVDVAVDPLIGYWSDRTPASFGRRRPFFLLGAIPGAVLFYFTLTPPTGSGFSTFLYLTAISSLMVCFLSLMGITHLAMAIEMTPDYDEQSRIFGYKNLIENLTILTATFSVPVAMHLDGISLFGHRFSRPDCYHLAAVSLAILSVVGALIAYLGTTEQPAAVPRYRFVDGVLAVLTNKAFLVLSITFLLMTIADRVVTAELFLVLEHFHGRKEEDSIALLAGFFLGGLASVWPWVWLAQQYGKDSMLRTAIVLWPIMCIAFVLQRYQEWQLSLIAVGMGVCGTGVVTMIGAIVPDVTRFQRKNAPERCEGMYVSIGNLIYQLSVGIGFLIAGLTLHSIGYEAETTHDEHVISMLRLTFAVVPTVLAIAALLSLAFFPVTKRTYVALIESPVIPVPTKSGEC